MNSEYKNTPGYQNASPMVRKGISNLFYLIKYHKDKINLEEKQLDRIWFTLLHLPKKETNLINKKVDEILRDIEETEYIPTMDDLSFMLLLLIARLIVL
jgi:hypothetical protein